MKITRSLAPWLAIAFLAAVLLGCDRNDPVRPDPDPVGTSDLTWQFQGLEPLGTGYVYEAWLVVGGEPISVGRFNVSSGGSPDLAGAMLTPGQIAGAQAFVVSIEPEVGDDPAPADTKVLGGAFVVGQATLSVGHAAALGDDFSGAAGAFILETPTTAAIAGDYNQGIWWLAPMDGPGPSLTLATLPAGWAYEGWVVTASGPQSTRRFTARAGADRDEMGGVLLLQA